MGIAQYSRKSLEVQLDIALNALFKAIESGKVEDLNFALDIFNLGSIKNNPLIEAVVVSFDGENYYDFNPFKAENLFCKHFLSGFSGHRTELDPSAQQLITAQIDDLKEHPNSYEKWSELGENLGKYNSADQLFKEVMIFLRNKRKEYQNPIPTSTNL
ncbi:MAG: hypothetical protein AABX70_02720 [Nanoarchaeota archaeon]